jgi:hypothetical protein
MEASFQTVKFRLSTVPIHTLCTALLSIERLQGVLEYVLRLVINLASCEVCVKISD